MSLHQAVPVISSIQQHQEEYKLSPTQSVFCLESWNGPYHDGILDNFGLCSL